MKSSDVCGSPSDIDGSSPGTAGRRKRPEARARPSPEAPAVAWSMEVVPAVTVQAGNDALDLLELGRLLQALADTSRIGQAAETVGVSYRSAWGRLALAERLLGVPLVERVKGHGSRLSASGADLVRALRLFERAGQRQLDAPLQILRDAVDQLTGAPEPPVRIAASHDLLLQEILGLERENAVPQGGPDAAGQNEPAPDEATEAQERESGTSGKGGSAQPRTTARLRAPRWSARFIGSEDALAALMAGQADIAGFHLPEPLPAPAERPEVLRLPGYFVEAVVRREQGLIVARGNPGRIHDVVDLARPGIRFVNRQRGAGTRTWFDRLLRERGLNPAGIRGYEREEFTHYAVAASVAAGLADAGFGLRAAADQLGLDFISIGMERYYLCGLQHWRNHPRVRALIHELRARATRASGYARCRSVDGQAG